MKSKIGFIYKLHSFQTRPHDGIYKYIHIYKSVCVPVFH